MKKILKRISLVICMLWGVAYGQTIGYLRYDSVKIYKNGGTSELILENATKGVTGGVLVNTWDGRTAFTLTPSLTGFWKTTGNAGTTAGTNFIGTTDNVDLVLKRNSVHSGRIGSSNTSFGYASLNLTATGVNNSAFGGSSLNALTTGNGNSVFGLNAGQFIDAGEYNTAIGHRALENNEIGDYNTSLGYYSGYNTGTTTANNNLFLGSYSGKYMTTEANRIFLNTLDRTDKEGDTISSPIYIAQHATAASQRLYLNSRVFAPYIPNTVTANSLYYDATTKEFSYGTAATGTVTGTGTANRGAYWDGTSSITSTANWLFDGTTHTLAANGAASTSTLLLTGNPSTAGTTTTDYPLQYFNGGTAPTTWSTNGTYTGWNAVSGFTGNIWDAHINGGTSIGLLNYQGNLTVAGTLSAAGGSSFLNSNSVRIGNSNGDITLSGSTVYFSTGINIGIGTTSPSSKLHVLSTTEQLRLGYDVSNYYSTTVGSTGLVTFNAVGAGSSFEFSDRVAVPKLKGNSSTPSIAGGSGAGTAPTVSITGTDLAGEITVTTDTDPTTSAVFCIVTFSTAYSTGVYVSLTPTNDAAALLYGNGGVSAALWALGETTRIRIFTNSSAAPNASTEYKFHYTAIQ